MKKFPPSLPPYPLLGGGITYQWWTPPGVDPRAPEADPAVPRAVLARRGSGSVLTGGGGCLPAGRNLSRLGSGHPHSRTCGSGTHGLSYGLPVRPSGAAAVLVPPTVGAPSRFPDARPLRWFYGSRSPRQDSTANPVRLGSFLRLSLPPPSTMRLAASRQGTLPTQFQSGLRTPLVGA
jgi:hypothetical protein